MFLNGFQIHSNTVDVGLVLYKNWQGLEGPDMRLSSYVRPGEHGAQISNQLYGGRTITLPGRIAARDITTYQSLRRKLMEALRIIKDAKAVSQPVLLTFTTMDGLQLQANVYLKDTLQLPTNSLENANFLISLFSPDAPLYSQSVSTYSISMPTTTGVVYPVIYPVTYPAVNGGQAAVNNAGDMDTPMVIIFNGPLTSPFITNLTTGETFLIHYTIPAGQYIIVDTSKNPAPSILLNGQSNMLQYFDLGNTWMELVPGNNNLKIGTSLTSDSGNVQVQFRSAYFGT